MGFKKEGRANGIVTIRHETRQNSMGGRIEGGSVEQWG